MSKRVSQSKRLQVIQKWLNGRDDPEYEVFPTKKKDKYIVRARKQPLIDVSRKLDLSEDKSEDNKIEPIIEEKQIEIEQPKITESKQIIKEERPKPIIEKEQPKIYKPKSVYDPTINIEILSQLKLLGEEIKSEREKKEQKRMMKEVFNKQMQKQHNSIYQYTQPKYIQNPNQIEEYDDEASSEEQITPQPIMRRRNNIFSDIIY
ncbi:hypothetical protein M9Y10_020174 [Tritrichomonas musculus]|uniref:Uncharacterized protein n=1 Tax=Tritrichomonas musculus TaxID=1915356 RepID=A0ABR2HGD6_9EUKA